MIRTIFVFVVMALVAVNASLQHEVARNQLYMLEDESLFSGNSTHPSNSTAHGNSTIPTNSTRPIAPAPVHNITKPLSAEDIAKQLAHQTALNKAAEAVNVAKSLANSAFMARETAHKASDEAATTLKSANVVKTRLDGIKIKHTAITVEMRNLETLSKEAASAVGRINGQLKSARKGLADNDKAVLMRTGALKALQAKVQSVKGKTAQEQLKKQIGETQKQLTSASTAAASFKKSIETLTNQLKAAKKALGEKRALVTKKTGLMKRVQAELKEKAGAHDSAAGMAKEKSATADKLDQLAKKATGTAVKAIFHAIKLASAAKSDAAEPLRDVLKGLQESTANPKTSNDKMTGAEKQLHQEIEKRKQKEKQIKEKLNALKTSGKAVANATQAKTSPSLIQSSEMYMSMHLRFN
eukprot:TRINITY_DN80193_c0_g1_i1.p1 TRINITY_DN80193_c0_g1~~TRINITY_DN80193_c0_g1_i1.p1  ORF type:complete len:412 (+),score=66.59 TRINITY_DN80193_c0_g1_i1:26-1261(+)